MILRKPCSTRNSLTKKRVLNQLINKTILKKLRIVRVKSAFDSITISRDNLDNVSTLIEYFDTISEKRLFLFSPYENKKEKPHEYKSRGNWFSPYRYHSLAAWIVAHFETRIFLGFLKKNEEILVQQSPLTNREVYIEIWDKLQAKEQDDLIRQTIEKIHRISDHCFVENKTIENSSRRIEKLKIFNAEEKIVKTILLMEQRNIVDKTPFKKELFDLIQKNQISKDKKNCDKVFVKSCLNINFESLTLDRFFMNLVFEYLEQIYFEKYLLQNIIEKEIVTKKKKKQKKDKPENAEVNVQKGKTAPSKIEQIFANPPVKVTDLKNLSKVKFLLFEKNEENENLENNVNSQQTEPLLKFPEMTSNEINFAVKDQIEQNGSSKIKSFSENIQNSSISINDDHKQIDFNHFALNTKKKDEIDQNGDFPADLRIPLLNEKNDRTLNRIGNINEAILIENSETGKNISRKGSMSVDIINNNRYLIEEKDQNLEIKVNSASQKKNLNKDTKNQKLLKNDNLQNETSDEEKQTNKSNESSQKNSKHVFERHRDSDFNSFSQNSNHYSVNESTSVVSVSESMHSQAENPLKKKSKNPKLRKIVKDAPYKKNYNCNTNGHVPSTNFPSPHQIIQKTVSYKEAESSKPFVNQQKNNIQKTPNPKEQKFDNASSKEESKVQQNKKTNIIKIKKVEEKPRKINFSKWEETERDIQNIQLGSIKNDNKRETEMQNHVNFEKSFSLKATRQTSNNLQENKEEVQIIRNQAISNPISFGTNDVEKKGEKSERENRLKKNIFRYQNHKNIVDYYPANSHEITQILSISELIPQNSFSLSDQTSSKIIGEIHHSTLRLSRFPESIFKEDGNLTSRENVINNTLVKLTRLLENDINKVVNSLEDFSKSLEKSKQQILNQISDIVARSFTQGISTKIYGSFVTGLLTPFSDLDVAIVGAQVFDNEKANEMLRLVRNNIMCYDFVINSTLLENAQVPVLKFDTCSGLNKYPHEQKGKPFTIKVDLIVDIDDGINEFNTAFRTTDYILYCKNNCSSFLKNTLTLKYFMNINHLSNTYFG